MVEGGATGTHKDSLILTDDGTFRGDYRSNSWDGDAFANLSIGPNNWIAFDGTADKVVSDLTTGAQTDLRFEALIRFKDHTPASDMFIVGNDKKQFYLNSDGTLGLDIEESATTYGPASIAANADDYFHRTDDSAWFDNTDLFIGDWSPAGNKFHSCFRFDGVTIPNGATITSAVINLRTQVSGKSGTILAKISAVDEDDPAAATNDATCDTDDAARTTAQVDWDFSIIDANDSALQTADFTSVIQELVDRVGWASGQAMLIHIEDDGTNDAFQYQLVAAKNHATYAAPTITIVYGTTTTHVYASSSIATWWNANAEAGPGGGNAYDVLIDDFIDLFVGVAYDADNGSSLSSGAFLIKQWPWQAWTTFTTDTDPIFPSDDGSVPWQVGVDPNASKSDLNARVAWVKGYSDKTGTTAIFNPAFNKQAATGGEWNDDGPNDDTSSTTNTWTMTNATRAGATTGRYVSSLYGYSQEVSDTIWDMK